MIKKVLFIVCLSALLGSCNNSKTPQYSDTSTSGEINIAVDESLRPIIEAEKDVFVALYPEAKVNIIYTNESEAINLLSKDSSRIAIVSRDLLPAERSSFETRKIYPKSIVIGYDAIGIIMNPARKDTVLTIDQITKLLNGTYKTWKDLDTKNNGDGLRIVFDNTRSSAVRQLKDSLLKGAALATHCYAVNGNPEVITQVEKDKNTIGIIGVSWISDKDDTTTNNFLNRVKVASLVPVNPATAEAPVMKPYQAYIALKQYPLYRNIYIINPEGRYGLGTGFASFINSDKGQRIILKSGLVPAKAPVRIIQLNND
ncbi:MAG: substrate-binding domain-containing protein [Bacteroidota bacterium]